MPFIDDLSRGIPLDIQNLIQRLPWSQLFANLLYLVTTWRNRLAGRGMYEVLEYESILELKDVRGKRAIFKKRQKVRYLQDNIIAYQDQAWGDGEILLDYQCSPGKPVDIYRPGRKTYVLISLQGVRQRNDVDEFNIQWRMENSFLRPKELWETEVSHPTRRLKMQIVFPKSRPPLQVMIKEDTRRYNTRLEENNPRRLADGRWILSFEIEKPRLEERYILEWQW
jgi:hypothetical protein